MSDVSYPGAGLRLAPPQKHTAALENRSPGIAMQVLQSVMLIDDNDADNYLHQRAIGDRAEEVCAFQDAREALQVIRAGEVSPELILLDINMPVMDGWQFLEAFSKLAQSQRSPVVIAMLTTPLSPGDHARAQAEAALQGFCSKPMTAPDYEQIVETYFPSAR